MCNETTGIWEPVNGIVKDNMVRVKGLKPGSPYLFRVKAVNNIGESPPVQTKNSVIAKNPFGKSTFFAKTNRWEERLFLKSKCDRLSFIDTPSAPEEFEITDYDKRSVSFEWKVPKSDGGNAIKG